jgi:Ca-activated chloride channel homolog
MTDIFGLMASISGSTPAPVPLTGVKAQADILGRGTKVKVSQRFSNRESNALEAVYRFPLPEGAAICGFRALIDERVIQGRIEEREKAFEIYDNALIEGHGAYLLDQERPNIFALSVGNLRPGCEVLMEIEYGALLDVADNVVRFALPTTISPRYIPGAMEEDGDIPTHAKVHPPYALEVPYGLSLCLNIHKGGSVKSIESPSHAIKVDNMKGDPVTVTFSSEEVVMDRDFILTISYEKAFQNRAYLHRTEEGPFVQLDLNLNDDKKSEEPSIIEPKEIIFVLDCSGSMMGDSISQAKKALGIALKALPTNAFFNICRFGSTFKFLFRGSENYSESSLSKGLSFLQEADADLGGTEILAPLKHICSSKKQSDGSQRNIILLTDGEVGNEQQIFDLVRERGGSLKVFAIGIGAGCNEYFIKGLARATGGASEFIFPGERIEPKVLSIFNKVSQTGLMDAVIEWGVPDAVQAPSLPAIFLGSPVTLFARFPSGDSFSKGITVKGALNGIARSFEIAVEEASNEALPVALLWARERIRDLEEGDDANLRKGSRQVRKQKELRDSTIIDLSKRFNLVSQLTSFVAVEEREEKDQATGEMVLREVPALVTMGWHGFGSVLGHIRQAFASCDYNLAMPAMPVGDYERRLRPERNYERRSDRESQIRFSICREVSNRTVKTISKKFDAKDDESRRIDDLLHLLSLQKAHGGIEIDDQAAFILGLNLNEMIDMAEEIEMITDSDKFILLSTAVVLVTLEKLFAMQRQIWEPMVQKSKEWLEEIIKDGNPQIKGKKLVDWVDEWVEKQTPGMAPDTSMQHC